MKLLETSLLKPTAALPAVVILAPAWRLGRRGASKRAVQDAVAFWRERCPRLLVACQAAAAPALRELADVVIIPEAEFALSSVACVLDACDADPVMIVDSSVDPSSECVDALLAVFGEEVAVAACVERERGLRQFPLLCRRSLRPLIEALLDEGCESVEDLLRRPCARLAAL